MTDMVRAHFIEFSLKEDFDRFCKDTPAGISIDYPSAPNRFVMVSGLRDDQINPIEAEYHAKVFPDTAVNPPQP